MFEKLKTRRAYAAIKNDWKEEAKKWEPIASKDKEVKKELDFAHDYIDALCQVDELMHKEIKELRIENKILKELNGGNEMGIKDMLLKKVVKEQFNIPAKLTKEQEEEYSNDIGIGKYYEERELKREEGYERQLRFDKSVKRAVKNNQINNVNYDYEQRHKKELEKIELHHKEELNKLMDHIKLLEKQINKLTITNDILVGKAKQQEKEQSSTMGQLNTAIEQLASEIFEK